MKKLLLFILLLTLGIGAGAQYIPNSFSYQAVARDEKGLPIVDEEIVVEISILSGSATGEVEWQEVHYPTTNGFGLFAINIGKGQSSYRGSKGSFEEIVWTDGPHFVKVRVDFGRSDVLNGFLDMGTVELQSVPYTLVADTALKAPIPELQELLDVDVEGVQSGEVLKWDAAQLKWVADEAIDPSLYLRVDGTSDLTGDWTIDTRNITMNYGSLNVARGDINMTYGSLVTNSIKLNGSEFTAFSTDADFASSNNTSLSSSQAIKTYVDSKIGNNFNGWVVSGNSVYNRDQRVGIGTSSPSDKLHVNVHDEAFMVEGLQNASYNFRGVDTGTFMFFFPGKSVFRCGTLDQRPDAWDDDQLGLYSQGFGRDTRVQGDYSVGFGRLNQANGACSAVFGESNELNSLSGHTLVSGLENTVQALQSAVIGYQNNVGGAVTSLIVGETNESEARSTLVVGKANTLTRASAEGCIVGGTANDAWGSYSLVIGNGCQSWDPAVGSVAMGYNAQTWAEYSFAQGYQTTADTYLEFVIGRYNKPVITDFATSPKQWYDTDNIFVIGNGVSPIPTDLSNALEVRKNGNMFISGVLTQSSDRRFKKNIVRLTNTLPKLQEINGVSYYWDKTKPHSKSHTDRKQIGVIAQEVEKVYPELVTTDAEGYKSVNYIGLVPVLLEAIKEQQKQIEQLKTDKDNKSTELNQLNQKYEAMNTRLELIEQLLLKATEGK